jgi:DNA repair exonuclease SbcCD ATPase subunit
MIPQVLTLQNFCQHRRQVLDFTGASVIALSSVNGGGKTNAFKALQFAYDGLKPGNSNKLSDDIHDDADKSIVDLTFKTTSGVDGRIIRTTRRSKNKNSVYLDIGGNTENSSTAALRVFGEYLGVHPSTIGNVVIADQHGIDKLLFTSKQQIGRFEHFLHGDTFTLPLAAAQKELESLYVDPQANERINALTEAIRQTQIKLDAADSALKTINVSLKSDKASKLETKQKRVDAFSVLKSNWTEAQTELTSHQSRLDTLRGQLALIPVDLQQSYNTNKTRQSELRKAWELYEAEARLLDTHAQLEAKLATCSQGLATHTATNTVLQKTTAQFHTLSRMVNYHKQEVCVEELLSHLTAAKQNQAHSVKQLAEQEATTVTVEKLSAQAGGLVQILRESQAITLKALHTHSDEEVDCPICASNLRTALAASPIEDRLDAAEKTYAPLQAQAAQARLNLNQLITKRGSLNTQVTTLQTGLDTAQAQLKLLPVPTKKLSAALDKAEAQLVIWEQEANKLPSNITRIEGLNAQITEALAAQAKLTPRPSVLMAQPLEPKTQLEALDTLLETQSQQLRDQVKLTTQQTTSVEAIGNLTAKIAKYAASAKEQELPYLTTEYQLTPSDLEYLTFLEQKREELAAATTEQVRYSTLLTQYTTDREKAQQAVDGVKDTKACQVYLNRVITRLKLLPQDILRGQLSAICRRMDSIIADFHIRKPFKLDVDKDLKFIMHYPSGIRRNIARASGGERIILGIAFRLAAHQKLAPELPWLVIDEPTNGLAPENIKVLADVIRHLKDNLGRYKIQKLIFSSHTPLITAQAEKVLTF